MRGFNESFQSSSGDRFWEIPEPSKTAFISEKIEQDSKNGIKSGIIAVVFMVLAFAYGLYMLISGDRSSILLMILALTVPIPAVIMFTDAIIATKRYVSKAKENRFVYRHVTVQQRRAAIKLTKNEFRVRLVSTEDPSDTAEVEIEKTLYDRMSEGLTGLFIMIDDEPLRPLVSPFWFISDTDPKYYPSGASAKAASQAESFAYFKPSEELRTDLERSYRAGYCSFIPMAVLVLLLFFIGAVCFLLAVLTSSDRTGSTSLMMFGFMTGLVGCLVLSVEYIRQIYEGKKSRMLLWAVWLNINVFAVFPIGLDKLPSALRILLLLALFVINIASTAIAHKESFNLHGQIRKGEYKTVNAVVVGKNIIRRPVMPLWINLCSVVAKSADGNSYEINVSKSQYKAINEGMKGLILILDSDPSKKFFLKG